MDFRTRNANDPLEFMKKPMLYNFKFFCAFFNVRYSFYDIFNCKSLFTSFLKLIWVKTT